VARITNLVLDPGQGSPLQIFRRAKIQPAVLTQHRLPRNRRRLWANAKRAAEALELLHSQGVIHRNVDPWALITDFGDQPDFRLTGFEWSMRLAAADSPLASLKPSDGRDGVASFGRDWTNLGILVSELIGAPLDRVSDLRLVPSEIAEHIVVEAFIRLMRVGWVELAPSAEGLTFVATEGGKTQIRSGILQAPTVTTPRWMSFLIDQVAGSVFRRTDIAVRHRNELSKIAENLVYLPKSPNHDREDLAELFAAMEGDDEVIVRVEPSPECLSEEFLNHMNHL
jgi:hypothetical protein